MKPPKIFKKILFFLLATGFVGLQAPFFPIYADDTDLFLISVKPNVLIILDNSNSFDEDFYGNGVGSFSSSSKSVVGRNVLIGLINTYINSMRVGLMTFRLSPSSQSYLHNSAYFPSYDPKSYCPNPPSEPGCVDYCQSGSLTSQSNCQATCSSQNSLFDATYLDEIVSLSPVGSQKRNTYCNLIYPKTQQIPNPTDLSNHIYYKMALPMYDSSNDGIKFLYSPGYSPNEYPPYYNVYDVWMNKTGTSDQEIGYSNFYWGWGGPVGFVPTDSDYALGYANFGRRLFWYYVGGTWFANSSPGGGYLQVAVNDNNTADNAQLNALLAMLAPHENDETGYVSCNNTGDPNQCSYIVNSGLTPTAGTLQSAINYFNGSGSYPSPIQYSCQKNYIVFVTDGLPSNDESGNPGSASSLMPAVVNKLNSLRSLTATGSGSSSTYDVKTFVVGVGLTSTDKVLLDSMAVAGGADVGGHAYYADNPTQLQAALGQIFYQIYGNSYSFSVTSVSSTRTTDENYTYQASFEPVNNDPFWRGHLEKFGINSDGSIGGMVWDAGTMLQVTPAATRNVLTYLSGSMTQFAAPQNGGLDWSQWQNYLMVDTNTAKTIIPYILGDPSFNPDNWKLGDTIHSNPISIGAPSYYFTDALSPDAFSTFRVNNQNRERIIVMGSNDGQVRAFSGSNGEEKWSFIPPNLLPKLQYIAHFSLPISPPESHQYFVDGPVTAADVWLGTGDGTSKSSSGWKTLMVFSEGRGVRNSTNTQASYLWSSSQYCDGNFNYQYTSTYKYYCGYWAFEVTNTSATTPNLIWRINPDATTGPYLDEPWGKMAIGRVKINGNEKWVGFIGAGYNNDGDSNRGKGFFVVDLSNGNILWSYTRGNSSGMTYNIPAPPAIVDTDNDGFVDTAYIGDLGGNIWRFKFCASADAPACSISNWSGGQLFQSSTATPIFTTPSVGRGSNATIWVFWGTGDKQNPTALGTQDRLFAVKDPDRTSTYTLSQLLDITNSIFSDTRSGWYISLASGEKVLADSAVFGGFISWTTYSPSSSGNPCNNSGSAKLYGVAMMPVAIGGVTYVPGAGLFGTSTGNEVGTRSIALGAGIAQVPLYSQKPRGSGATDLFVTTSGGADQSSSIVTSAGLPDSPFKSRLQMTAPSTQILRWWDQRVQ